MYYCAQRLQWLAELVYPESQSGYRSGRRTVDGIFILRQMTENCREQQQKAGASLIHYPGKAWMSREFCQSHQDAVFGNAY